MRIAPEQNEDMTSMTGWSSIIPERQAVLSRRRVPLRKQPVGELEHLALETNFRERLREPYPVLACERSSVGLLEGREGKLEDLDRRSDKG